jgi:transcriptional regulator with XRE-family HTH domain
MYSDANFMQEKNSHGLKDFSVRLELALRRAGMTKRGLADAIGVPASTVSRWKGIHHPSPVLMNSVAKTLGVRREWLVVGLDPMSDGPDPQSMTVKDGPELPAFYDAALRQIVDFLDRIRAGTEPLSKLERVYGMLDILHPMPQHRQPKTKS